MTLTIDQLATRHLTLGASEIAAVAGLNPWKTAHDVWLLKLQLAESSDNVRTRMGNRVEACVLAEYCETEGVEAELMGTVVHPSHGWMSATPDARIKGARRLLEIKCVGWRMAHHWGTEVDAIPEYYRPQVEQQMEVCDVDECHVAAWIGGSEFRIYTIKRDRELAGILTEIGRRFWHEHVIPGIPPPVDGSEGARRMLDKLFPRNTKPMLQATPELSGLAARLREAKVLTERAEAEQAAAQNKIIEALGDAEGVAAPDFRITYRADKAGKRRFLFKTKEAA